MQIESVTDPASADKSGVPHAAELIALADATVRGSQEERAAARSAVQGAMGPEALVDAGAIIGNFERMNRIADATGIELDPPVRTFSAELREELGINEFAGAELTKPTGAGSKILTKILWPVMKRMYTRPTAKN